MKKLKVWKGFLKSLSCKLPEKWVGEEKLLMQRYEKLYGAGDFAGKIADVKKKNATKYMALTLIALIFSVFSLLIASEGSDNNRLIKEGGSYTVYRPSPGEESYIIPVTLSVKSPEGSIRKQIDLRIEPQVLPEGPASTDPGQGQVKKSKEEAVDEAINNMLFLINREKTQPKVILPGNLSKEISLDWELRKDSKLWLLLPFMLIGILLIKKSLYEGIKKEEQEAMESIKRELPGFLNKLVLLLNAGLVLSTAVERVCGSSQALALAKTSYFYSRMAAIQLEIVESRCPLPQAFGEFAGRSGSKELQRIANIMSDNLYKGTGLVEKLEGESEMLWLIRKKGAEEEGRLAETKLSFPLAILLLALVIITVSPALLDM